MKSSVKSSAMKDLFQGLRYFCNGYVDEKVGLDKELKKISDFTLI